MHPRAAEMKAFGLAMRDYHRRRKKERKPDWVPRRAFVARYRAYLASDAWRVLRERLFRERGRWCEECGCRTGLQIHHRHYRNLFNERVADLMVLCSPCHQAKHPNKKAIQAA